MNRQAAIALERRRFLKVVGASALTYPFLRGVPSFAAAGGTAPTYLVLLFTPCGCVRPAWGATDANMRDVLPPAIGGAPTSTTSFVFRDTLAALAPVRSSVIILDGLNNKAAQGSHEAGMASLWTGLTSTGNPATGPSVDQVIASRLAAGTPFPSIELMARSSADFTDREVKTRMIYNAAGAFMDPHDDPAEARATFFPPAVSSSGMSASDRRNFIRQKLFPQLNGELTALQPRLCTEDRQQLQSLQEGWNALDQQLAAAAAKAATCMPPGAVPAGYHAPSPDFPTTVKLQMDLLALALACDLTRVSSLQLSTATSQVTHSWLTGQSDTHHNYSHQGPQSLYALAPCTSYNNQGLCATTPDLYSVSNLNLYQNLAQQKAIDSWYAQQVAYLAQKLASFSGANGGTLLDQSVICWGSELDMGAAHNHDDTPFVLIGGANGQLATGQMVTFPLDLIDGDPTVRAGKDRAHNDLLLTLAKVMGQDLPCVGDSQYCGSPITQILT
jgi:Protein of unknown function (DUF1552)